MTDIIIVLNKIIENSNRIDQVVYIDRTFYFVYMKQYLWSIQKQDGTESAEYTVEFYPKAQFKAKDHRLYIEQLLSNNNDEEAVAFTYSTQTYNSITAVETFEDLYRVVSGGNLGANEAFQAILNS